MCGVKQNRRGHDGVNLYDDGKVFLRWPHGNNNLDIVRVSYTRRKANVTEALSLQLFFRFLADYTVFNTTKYPS